MSGIEIKVEINDQGFMKYLDDLASSAGTMQSLLKNFSPKSALMSSKLGLSEKKK